MDTRPLLGEKKKMDHRGTEAQRKRFWRAEESLQRARDWEECVRIAGLLPPFLPKKQFVTTRGGSQGKRIALPCPNIRSSLRRGFQGRGDRASTATQSSSVWRAQCFRMPNKICSVENPNEAWKGRLAVICLSSDKLVAVKFS